MLLECGSRALDLNLPKLMGILNVTPDSFSDGGQLFCGHKLNLDKVLYKVERMIAGGAEIIDVGGESTRPGALVISDDEELARVIPAIELIAKNFDVIVSVDTSSASVITAAVGAGAGFVNDVRAFSRPGAMAAAVNAGVPVCLMHMKGEPQTMQFEPSYENVVEEVREYLQARSLEMVSAGLGSDKIIVDPGYGFGKSTAHNIQLLRGQSAIAELGSPVLVGLSRKSMIGDMLGRAVGERLIGSVALAWLAVQRGARILRVHDVDATRDMLIMMSMFEE